MSSVMCPSCQAFAGTFQKANKCCQVRLLMEAPKHVRIATYAAVQKDQGQAALEELKAAVRAEYQRKMEWKTRKAV